MLCVVESRLCLFNVRHSVVVNMIMIDICHHQHYFININMILSIKNFGLNNLMITPQKGNVQN